MLTLAGTDCRSDCEVLVICKWKDKPFSRKGITIQYLTFISWKQLAGEYLGWEEERSYRYSCNNVAPREFIK